MRLSGSWPPVPWLPRVSRVVEAVDTSLRDLLARRYPWPMVRRDLAQLPQLKSARSFFGVI
jgi:hypothetical protein